MNKTFYIFNFLLKKFKGIKTRINAYFRDTKYYYYHVNYQILKIFASLKLNLSIYYFLILSSSDYIVPTHIILTVRNRIWT